MVSNRTVRIFILIVLSSIPLIYGARHPIIHGLYSSVLLLFCGSVLIFRHSEHRLKVTKPFTFIPIFLIFYVFLSSISIPLPLLEILTPYRSETLQMAKNLGGVLNQDTALAYYAPFARFYAVYFLSLFCYFFILRHNFYSKKFLKFFLITITSLGTFEAIYGLLQSMNPALGVLWIGSADDVYRGVARGTIIYRNQYALLLNLCWPAAAALGLILLKPVIAKYKAKKQRRGRLSLTRKLSIFSDRALIPLFLSGLMILAIIFSQSRAGILIMLFILLLFLSLLPIQKKNKISAIVVLFLFIFFYGMMLGGFSDISHRFSQLIEGIEIRFTIWYASLTMFTSHLFTGIGMGNYELLSPVFLENVPDKFWFDRAHNEYLEIIIELGFPIATLFFLWLFSGFIKYAKIINSIRNTKKDILNFKSIEIAAIAVFCSLAAFLLHGTVDFVWRLPANVFYMVSLLALLSFVNRPEEEK